MQKLPPMKFITLTIVFKSSAIYFPKVFHVAKNALINVSLQLMHV